VLGACCQHHDPLVVLAEGELASRADHAVRDDTLHLPALDPETARQLCSDRSERHDVADGEVPGAAHDLDRLAPAPVHDNPPDTVGSRDRGDLEDLSEHDVVETFPDSLDPFHHEPEGVELPGQVGDGGAVGR
jgi:hypothetical protein